MSTVRLNKVWWILVSETSEVFANRSETKNWIALNRLGKKYNPNKAFVSAQLINFTTEVSDTKIHRSLYLGFQTMHFSCPTYNGYLSWRHLVEEKQLQICLFARRGSAQTRSRISRLWGTQARKQWSFFLGGYPHRQLFFWVSPRPGFEPTTFPSEEAW